MLFNPDPSRQVTEVLFSRRGTLTPHPALTFNDNVICSKVSHKHLEMVLRKKLTFGHHLKEKISNANKGIGLIIRPYSFLTRKTLIDIYKACVINVMWRRIKGIWIDGVNAMLAVHQSDHAWRSARTVCCR